jgi:glycine/sarcosine N-methyltransferase
MISDSAPLSFGVADLRELGRAVAGTFDVVLSCDNALPHILSDEGLLRAARNMAAKLRPGGLLLVSMRDYDRASAERPRSTPPRAFEGPEGRRIVFQVWDWASDGRTYLLHQFIVREARGDWRTAHYATQYRALRRGELSELLRSAGLSEIRWHMPEESGYYQPIVTARKGLTLP